MRRPARCLALAAVLAAGSAACREEQVLQAFPDSYVGIGVELQIGTDQVPVVMDVIPGGTAHAAGLEPGDRLLALDGRDQTGRSLAEVVAAIRGPVGAPLVLDVRKHDNRVVQVRVERRPISRAGEGYQGLAADGGPAAEAPGGLRSSASDPAAPAPGLAPGDPGPARPALAPSGRPAKSSKPAKPPKPRGGRGKGKRR